MYNDEVVTKDCYALTGCGAGIVGQGNSDDDEPVQALHSAASFTVATPIARPSRRDALVAIPSPALAAMATRVASAFGFRVFLAGSSAEAAASVGGRAFDLILLEAAAETGFWVRRIRALPGGLSAAPIIALGACHGDLWREDAAEAGLDGFVSEPVTLSGLISLTALLMGAPAEANGEPIEP